MEHQEGAILAQRLRALANNLFWTWHPPTQRLFERVDPLAWRTFGHAPIRVLEAASPERLNALIHDSNYVHDLEAAEHALERHLNTRSWYEKHHLPRTRIAYFSMEFALHESLPIYSGGLGVLAGDHLKSASDLGVPLCAVGLMYHRGFYTQRLDRHGDTVVEQPVNDPELQPLTDTGVLIDVPMGRRTVTIGVWKAQIGRVPLYLLDANVEENRKVDRELTAQLYSGDNDMRIRQEILLGIGGMLALDAVGEKVRVCHLNEGHAAFCALARIQALRERGISLEKSIERVRERTVFTTHTPVPAGHDRFDIGQTWRYVGPMAQELGFEREQFIDLGREDDGHGGQNFCMTVLALNLSGHRNGVSKLHGHVSRDMWREVFEVHNADDVPIGHVTNGVHTRTWMAPEADRVLRKHLHPRWEGSGPGYNPWEHADRIPDEDLWEMRHTLRAKLVNFVRSRLHDEMLARGESGQNVEAVHTMMDENVLTVGFARRFATYKRAPLVFSNMERIEAILNHSERPVQLIFAGKAHPADEPGQQLIRKIHAIARKPGFRGRVVLLENYDMHLGRVLTAGCDVWLNNPIRPHEASGTSGMKPPLHGGLNCSILDGWWPECYNGRNGWEIGGGKEFSSRRQQDLHDAGAIHWLLEEHIAPLFYDRDERGIPAGWVEMMRESMRTVCSQFSTQRMVGDYVNQLYVPASGH